MTCSAVLVVDELQLLAVVDRRCCLRPSRLRNWRVCTHPMFTRQTASELATIYRTKSFCPESAHSTRVIHSLHPRHTPCLLGQLKDWKRQSLQPTVQGYHRIFLTGYELRFSAARASGTFVGRSRSSSWGFYTKLLSFILILHEAPQLYSDFSAIR